MEKIQVKVISQSISKDQTFTPTVHENAYQFAQDLTKIIQEDVKDLVKDKPWVNVVVGVHPKHSPNSGQPNGRIEALFCGPLRMNEEIRDGKVIKSVRPMFKLALPMLSAKTLSGFSEYKGFSNSWATKDFYKRLIAASQSILNILEEQDGKEEVVTE